VVHLGGLHPVCASRVSRKACYARGFEPYVLVDDRLVLELKIDPKEGEKDRLVGQCCKYS
jgi:hypothetical protein